MTKSHIPLLRGLADSFKGDPVNNTDHAKSMAEGLYFASTQLHSLLDTIERGEG